MTPEGIKTAVSDQNVSQKYVKTHLNIGIDALLELANRGESVKHMTAANPSNTCAFDEIS